MTKVIRTAMASGVLLVVTGCVPEPTEVKDKIGPVAVVVYTDEGWSIGTVDPNSLDISAGQAFAATTIAQSARICPTDFENPIPVRSGETPQLIFTSVTDSIERFPVEVCVPQWELALELYPGTTFNTDFDDAVKVDVGEIVCGSCVDDTGTVRPETTIAFVGVE